MRLPALRLSFSDGKRTSITIMGTPTQVSVTLTVDGAVILNRTETPTYQKTQPNGPKCEPTCQQASVKWTFSTT